MALRLQGVRSRLRTAAFRRTSAGHVRFELEVLEERRLLHAGHDHDLLIPLDLEDHSLTGDDLAGQQAVIAAAALNPLSSIPVLNSLPGADVTLYLDFDGYFESVWGSYANITTPVFDRDGDLTTFSDSELANMETIWRYVAEDFSPFPINVTTVEPPNFNNGEALRVAIGGNGSWTDGTYGGIAYVNNFVSATANTVYVFPKNLGNGNPKSVAEASSHESGHAFGLAHQSAYNASGTKTAEYYSGPGDGRAPIMGNSYSATRGLWWNGTSSASSTTIQDDLAVLSRPANGFGYRPDDHGNNALNATALVGTGNLVSGSGVLTTTSDVDYFSFETNAGDVTVSVTVPSAVNNLDARIELRDSSGNLIASAAPSNSFNASLTANVPAGSYRVVVASQGNYGDIGTYTVSAVVRSLSLGGFVYEDSNRNGERDLDEPGLAGWTVFDDLNNNGVSEGNPLYVLPSADAPKPIADIGSATSTIAVSGLYGMVQDIDVEVNIDHANAAQLVLVLIAPDNTIVTLANRNGGSGTNFTGTVFDQQAAASIATGAPPFTGSYQPVSSLAALNGRNPTGNWRLLVNDGLSGATGTLLNWSLHITTDAVEAEAISQIDGSYEFTNLAFGPHQLRLIPNGPLVPTEPTGGLYNVVFSEGVPQVDLNFGNAQPVVLGRALFYNDSKYDGHNAGIDVQDFAAIASDKQAYVFGQGPSTFANVSSSTKGINGLLLDIFGSHPNITADDFTFRVGNDESPENWSLAPEPISVSVLAGAGTSSSDRVAIVWSPGAIQNSWLEVRVAANSDTGLADLDSFYFGHALGNSGLGDTATHALVNTTDELGTRNNPASVFSNIPLTNVFDFNRDGAVNFSDSLVPRNHPAALGTALRYIELGGILGGPGSDAGGSADDPGASIALASATQAFPSMGATSPAPLPTRLPLSNVERAPQSSAGLVAQMLCRISIDEFTDWQIELDDAALDEKDEVA